MATMKASAFVRKLSFNGVQLFMRLFWANFKHCAVHFIPFRLHCSDYLGRIIWDESPLGLGRWSEEGKGLPDFELSVEKGGHKNSSTKGWERVVKIEVVSFLFPFSSILKGGKKLLFWHALPLPTIQDGLEWEEPDIRLKQASWEDTIYFQITTQIKLVHTQCWKMILPFWDCESDKCFLLSFESPWKWQKQCNKVLKAL